MIKTDKNATAQKNDICDVLGMFDALDALVRQVGALLQKRGLKLITVESCTGGMIAAALTNVAGSSAYFEYGLVTYSDRAKMELLGVAAAMLQQHGAVSAVTVQAMVEGGLRWSSNGVGHADVGLAVTGVAGPGGGSATKPVGTVYFAWKVLDKPTVVMQQLFTGDRYAVRLQATMFALEQLAGFLAVC